MAPRKDNGTEAGDAKARLLAAARREFLKKGFAGASLREIARQAGLTTGPLYWHFRDKEDLFGALVAPAWDALFALHAASVAHYREAPDADRARRAIESGRAFVEDLIGLVRANRTAFRLLLRCADGTRWAGLPAALARAEFEGIGLYEASIRASGASTLPPLPDDVWIILAGGMCAAVLGAAVDGDDEASVRETVHRIHDFYVAGVFAACGVPLPPKGLTGE